MSYTDYVDTERLIMEVQKYPCIYDRRCPDYKNRIMKMESWQAITVVLTGGDEVKMEPQERNTVCTQIQKRWKSITDSYLRTLKFQPGRSGDAVKKKKPYVYSKQMSFLQSCSQLTETTESSEESVPIPDETSLSPNVSAAPLAPSVSSSPKQSRKRKYVPDPPEQEIPSVIKSNVGQPQHNSDPDEMFLLSQIPVIKKFSQTDKLDFQVKFLQLVQSYSQR